MKIAPALATSVAFVCHRLRMPRELSLGTSACAETAPTTLPVRTKAMPAAQLKADDGSYQPVSNPTP
jgi:hypothetical protein